ncbi:MAG: anhydro-N-acetylmuramic acid kinase, partial [Rhizobiaceae bacterium]
DFTEAEAWAFLAIRSRSGLPLTWPTTSGCRAPATGGIVAEP